MRRYQYLNSAFLFPTSSSDLENKVIHCVTQVPGTDKSRYSLDYDTLVIAVGSYSNTFGIPGVKENACFLKDVQDARKIRKRLIECKLTYNTKYHT